MTTEFTALAQRLDELAEAPAPPSRVDIDGARIAGRRRVRLRRAGVSGVATLVLASGLALTVLPRHGSADQPAGAASADPLVTHASFGWLPGEILGVGYQVGAHGDVAVARGATGLNTPYIWLSLYPAGHTPTLDRFPTGAAQLSAPAQQVNGRTAYWVTEDSADPTNRGDAYLRWQLADGRWAELHAYNMKRADLTMTLHHVASTVTTGEIPVPLPIRISGLPHDLRLYEVDLNRPALQGRGAWTLQLIYQADGVFVDIDVAPAGTASKPAGAACTTARGLDVCVDAIGGAPPPVAAIGGVAGLLRRITPLGTDEREWTTEVLVG